MIFRLLNRYCLGRIMGFAMSVTMISIIGFLPLAAQAQFGAVPADFDRLLVGEMVLQGNSPSNSNCKAAAADTCSGVLYVRFESAEINEDAGTGGADQLVVRMGARAGQAAIGSLTIPGICRNAAGDVVPNGADSALFCSTFGGPGEEYTPEEPGTISRASPANVMASAGIQFAYNTSLLSCVGSVDDHVRTPPVIAAISPSSGLAAGVLGYTYSSNQIAQNPAGLTADQVVVRPHDSYVEHVTVTCDLPTIYNTESLNMAFEVGAFSGINAHLDAPNAQVVYIVSAENSLEFFPLDETNYITHAEITEGGDGVLIEYAEAVADNTNQAYRIMTGDGLTDVTPAISDTIWLNNQTVWLALGSDIYDNAGINTHASVAQGTDRHVLVSSTLPDDTSFEVEGTANFGGASTYRAVLTRHMSNLDIAQTAPRILDITVAPGTESIDLTFSRSVCGSPGTGCDPLTANHFEVMHYGETEPRALTIDSVDLTGDATAGYTAATLNLASVDIGGNDYVLVRTAKNSRFSDQFITDRTVFSATKATRTVPANIPVETYDEADSGMLHLQSGALARAIPTIVYTLTNPGGNSDDFSTPEGDLADSTTSTFTVTREPTGYTSPTDLIISVTRNANSNSVDPTNFVVLVEGTAVTESIGIWTQGITFAATEDTKTIDIQHEGNDAPNDDYIYTIGVAPATFPGGGSRQLTYTITDDEDDIPPTIPARNIAAAPGATQVTLRFQSAYDTIGSLADPNNRTYTRDVNYEITIERITAPFTSQTITMSAEDLGVNLIPVPLTEDEAEESQAIEILLTRSDLDDNDNNIVLIPNNAYRVTISVIDAADERSSQSYDDTFTMLTGRDLIREELDLANINCGTDADGDSDGIASAYERVIGTNCLSSFGEPAPISIVGGIMLPSSPADVVLVRPAGDSTYTYTQIDTGVTCSGAACNNLKAFIVSSGLTGDASDDAVSMVTEICPDSDDGPSLNSCWIDDVSVDTDGNVGAIPLQLGYNLIDWVATDSNGKLTSTRQKQVYICSTGCCIKRCN